jgi:hypothetical protein
MRSFLRDHWKAIVAIILLIVLALFTVNPSAAVPEPTLAERLRTHVAAVAWSERDTATPDGLEAAAPGIPGQRPSWATSRAEYRGVRGQGRAEHETGAHLHHRRPV